MEVISSVLNWFLAIFCRIRIFRGSLGTNQYALLKKPAHVSLFRICKATVGYMLLNVGAREAVTTFRPILQRSTLNFKLVRQYRPSYFGPAAANNKIAAEFPDFVGTATALLIGFGVNILLVASVNFTKVRTLFITGHIMVQQAATVSLMVLFGSYNCAMLTVQRLSELSVDFTGQLAQT